MDFKEISNWHLTPEECKRLKTLSENGDFKFFREYLEKKLIKMSFDLAIGTPVPGVDTKALLDELRGACRLWREITLKIDNLK